MPTFISPWFVFFFYPTFCPPSNSRSFLLQTAYPTDLDSEMIRCGVIEPERARFYMAELVCLPWTDLLESINLLCHRSLRSPSYTRVASSIGTSRPPTSSSTAKVTSCSPTLGCRNTLARSLTLRKGCTNRIGLTFATRAQPPRPSPETRRSFTSWPGTTVDRSWRWPQKSTSTSHTRLVWISGQLQWSSTGC